MKKLIKGFLSLGLLFCHPAFSATFDLDCSASPPISGPNSISGSGMSSVVDTLNVTNAPAGTVIIFDYLATSGGNKTIGASSTEADPDSTFSVSGNGSTATQVTTVASPNPDSALEYTITLNIQSGNNRSVDWTATCDVPIVTNLQLAKTWVNGVVGDAITASTSGLTTNATLASTSTGNNTDTGSPVVITAGEVVTLDAEIFTTGSAANYTTSDWVCNDSAGSTVAAGGTLTIDAADVGNTITCTVTNELIESTLTLVKEVVNDNGGSAVVGDFVIMTSAGALTFGAATGSGTSSDPFVYSSDPLSVLAGTYTLIESDVEGYSEGIWGCAGAAGSVVGTFDGGSVVIANGETVTCTITNDDVGADLGIEKNVNDTSPSVGDIITFTLNVVNNGPDDAINVVVDDIVQAGFTFVAGSMMGGDIQNQTAPNLQWTINNLSATAPNNVVSLMYQATVNAP